LNLVISNHKKVSSAHNM